MAESSKTKRLGWIFLVLIPLAGAAYWLTRPSATDDIEQSINDASVGISTITFQTDPGNSENGGVGADWQSNIDQEDDGSDDAGLSIADAQNLLANAELLAGLPEETMRMGLPSDPTVRRLLKAAKRIIREAEIELPQKITSNLDIADLTKAEQIELATTAEAQIGEIAVRFESAALDQAIEKLVQAESELRVLKEDLRGSLPTNVSLPKDPLSLAPTDRLKIAVEGLKVQQRMLADRLADLGVKPQSGGMLTDARLAHVETWINRINSVIESSDHKAFQETKSESFKSISKKNWNETAIGFDDRVKIEVARRQQELLADTGLQEIKFGSRSIRGPPEGSIDALVLSALRNFDTNPRQWLISEASVQGLGDQLISYSQVRNVSSEIPNESLRRVATLLDEATLRNGRTVANAVVLNTPELPENQVFPGRKEHFERYAEAFEAELARRREGGSRVTFEATEPLGEVVDQFCNVDRPTSRAEARILSLASTRFPEERHIPIGVREEIVDIQRRTLELYSERTKSLLSNYERVADHLALSTDAAPDLLEKFKSARTQLKAVNIEFDSMVKTAKQNGVEIESAKAILVQLESMFPRGPPGEGPPPTAPAAPKNPPPKPSGSGGLVTNASDLERLRSVSNPVAITRPQLEKQIYFTAAYLAEADRIIESTGMEADGLNRDPVEFAKEKGRRTYNLRDTALAQSGEPDWRSIAKDNSKTRLPESKQTWRGRLKEDPRTGRKVPFDYRTEVKKPRTFRAIGGGIHFGETASAAFDAPANVYSLRYDAGSLIVTDGRNGSRFVVTTQEDIDPTSLKALYRFAKANRNAAISIGWGTERESVVDQLITESRELGSPVLLDPFLVDTAVGQDLVLADSIPWSFDGGKLPNGAPVTFHEQFKNEYDQFRKARLDVVTPLFANAKPFADSDRAMWTTRLDEARASLLIQAVVRNDSIASARRWYISRSIRDFLRDEENQETSDETAIQDLRRWLLARILKANDIDSLDDLTSEGQRLVNKDADDRIEKLSEATGGEFDKRIAPLFDEDSPLNSQLLPLVDLTMAATLSKESSCPRVLVDLWASLLLAKSADEPVDTETLALSFLARLNSTTLAMLYDDAVSFDLQGDAAKLKAEMKYRYATTYVHVGDRAISLGRSDDAENEVQTIESLTILANKHLNGVTDSYPPLKRVTQQAAITAFLKWAIAQKERGNLAIDLSELATVPAHDPKKYPTPDSILK